MYFFKDGMDSNNFLSQFKFIQKSTLRYLDKIIRNKKSPKFTISDANK